MKTLLIAASTLLALTVPSQDGSRLIADLEELAAANNAEAIYHLGMAYQTGTGVPQDKRKALDAFRRAATAGDPLASYKLGCFYDGQGNGLIEEDFNLALRHKLIAAEAGYALAQQDVAFLLSRRGDTEGALAWLEKAAAQGWPDALAAYASVHNGAAGVPRDPAKVAAYFRLFLARTAPTERQMHWLAEFESALSGEDKLRADEIVKAYHPRPTPITVKALAGQRTAEELVAKHR